ncbi:MAG: site-specific integrase [Lachnospiraceae bacterium]|nr:site-specific integrase [Lachnospiraceae bacterium]
MGKKRHTRHKVIPHTDDKKGKCRAPAEIVDFRAWKKEQTGSPGSTLYHEGKYANVNPSVMREVYKHMQDEKKRIENMYAIPAKPSSDGFYHIAVRDETKANGRRHIKAKSTGELIDKLYAHEKGISGTFRKSFRDVYEIVREERLKYIKDAEKRLSVQNTVGRDDNAYQRFFAGTDFELLDVDAITKRDIENICILNLTRYDLRLKAFSGMKSILKKVFDLSYREYWIIDNPFARINWSDMRFVNMILPEKDVSERGYSDEEMEKIRRYLQEKHRKNPAYLPAYALEMQIIMGLRRGEVPALRWSDIHESYIEICREQITVKRNGGSVKEHFQIVNHTKTNKNRRYPITKELDAFLERLRAVHREQGITGDYLFPAESQTGVITNNAVYNFYRRMCRKLEIPISRDLTRGPHGFRRNAITDVVERSGGNIIMAAQLFGNSPEVAKKNYYTGLNMANALAVLDA